MSVVVAALQLRSHTFYLDLCLLQNKFRLCSGADRGGGDASAAKQSALHTWAISSAL